MDAMNREVQKERVSFKDLRTVKNDSNYDDNGKRILKNYEYAISPIVQEDYKLPETNGGVVVDTVILPNGNMGFGNYINTK